MPHKKKEQKIKVRAKATPDRFHSDVFGKGLSHPKHRNAKLIGGTLTAKQADKTADKLIEKPGVVDVIIQPVNRHQLIFLDREAKRITPKRPKLRR